MCQRAACRPTRRDAAPRPPAPGSRPGPRARAPPPRGPRSAGTVLTTPIRDRRGSRPSAAPRGDAASDLARDGLAARWQAAFTERARVVTCDPAAGKRKTPAVAGAASGGAAGVGDRPAGRPACDGGGGGNRTRVRKPFPRESYRRVRPFESRARPLRPAGSSARQPDWISSSAPERELWTSLRLSDARIQPPQAGSGRPSLPNLARQREPSARWQLNFPAFLTRSRVPGLHFLVHDPRRDLSPPSTVSRRRDARRGARSILTRMRTTGECRRLKTECRRPVRRRSRAASRRPAAPWRPCRPGVAVRSPRDRRASACCCATISVV